MAVSVNRMLGPNDRCSLGGAVISAFLCAVVEGDTIVGWTENSGFMVREVGVDGTLAPLNLTALALALEARNLDAKAAKAGVVGISSLIAETSHSGTEYRESSFSVAGSSLRACCGTDT